MYKKLINPMTGQLADVVLLVESNSYIPMVEDNTDYQAYLKWLAEGNVPNSPDENVNEG
jgi:hypothetical protein